MLRLKFSLTCKLSIESVKIFYFPAADVASTRYTSFMRRRYKEKTRLEELNWFSGLSLPNKEIWLDEFCRIRKSQKLAIETYHCMRKYDFCFIRGGPLDIRGGFSLQEFFLSSKRRRNFFSE